MPRNTEEEEFINKLGKRITSIREEKNMKLSEVARLLYMERGNYSRIETGKTNPSIVTLYKLSKVLGCEIQDFFVD